MSFMQLFVFVLVLSRLKDITLSYLNKKTIRGDLQKPLSAQELINGETLRKALQYNLEKEKLNIFRSFFMIPFTLTLFISTIPSLERAVLRIENPFLVNFLVLASVCLIYFVIDLPFSAYREFVAERKFGFSRVSTKDFFIDFFKRVLVSLVVVAIISGVTLLIDKPLLAIRTILLIFVVAFVFLAELVLPSFFIKMFYKLTPLVDEDINSAIDNIVKKAGIHVSGTYVINASRRSKHTNAFVTGFGKRKKVVLFDTLVQDHPADEVAAIFAHEVGHHTKKHIVKGFVITSLISVISFVIFMFAFDSVNFGNEFGVSSTGSVFLYIAFLILNALSILQFIANSVSRRFEYEADLEAARLTSPEVVIKALKRLVRTNLSNINPHPIYEFYYYSHPSPVKRIQALQKQYNLEGGTK